MAAVVKSKDAPMVRFSAAIPTRWPVAAYVHLFQQALCCRTS